MNVFCVTSQYSPGCTFLEWSMHWLAGHQHYYKVDKKVQIPLTSCPLMTSQGNAHGHQKNHCAGLTDTQHTVSILCGLPRDQIYSFYPTVLPVELGCQSLGLDPASLQHPDVWAQLIDYIAKDYNALIKHCLHNDIFVAHVYFDQPSLRYTWSNRTMSRSMIRAQPISHDDECVHEYDEIFCRSDIDSWSSHHVWDIRERLALSMRPFKFNHLSINDEGCHRIYCRDLWFNTQEVTVELMSLLGLDIVGSRFDLWLPMVNRWQMNHHKILWFAENLNDIVNAIVQGRDMPLPDLTLKQECIVQHCLIYQHNLNLKTWNLSKFPNNTLELHSLLEPNIHDIGVY